MSTEYKLESVHDDYKKTEEFHQWLVDCVGSPPPAYAVSETIQVPTSTLDRLVKTERFKTVANPEYNLQEHIEAENKRQEWRNTKVQECHDKFDTMVQKGDFIVPSVSDRVGSVINAYQEQGWDLKQMYATSSVIHFLLFERDI